MSNQHKLNLSAKEVEEKLAKIPGDWHEVVDQEYKSNSPHAQSGTAVASAISSFFNSASVNLAKTSDLESLRDTMNTNFSGVSTELDSVVHTINAKTGISINRVNGETAEVGFDDSVTFVLDAGTSADV